MGKTKTSFNKGELFIAIIETRAVENYKVIETVRHDFLFLKNYVYFNPFCLNKYISIFIYT